MKGAITIILGIAMWIFGVVYMSRDGIDLNNALGQIAGILWFIVGMIWLDNPRWPRRS